jgi:predicted RNA-binding protein with PIN domain
MKLGAALQALRQSELELAVRLREISERHKAEADVHHVTTAFVAQCEDRAKRLEPLAARYSGVEPDDELLSDLRQVYLRTQETLLDWTMVAQGARAARDRELLKLAEQLSSEVEAQMKWTLTKIKEASPQALTS